MTYEVIGGATGLTRGQKITGEVLNKEYPQLGKRADPDTGRPAKTPVQRMLEEKVIRPVESKRAANEAE